MVEVDVAASVSALRALGRKKIAGTFILLALDRNLIVGIVSAITCGGVDRGPGSPPARRAAVVVAPLGDGVAAGIYSLMP